MRRRIFEIIEVAKDNDRWSQIYDTFMMITICISIIPLAFKEQTELFLLIDKITVLIFVFDYILRLFTADLKLNKGKLSFVCYPFSFMAIVDLLSILPSIFIVNSGLKLLKVFRLFRTFRVFRVFKTFRYSKNIQMVLNVFKEQKESLTIVCVLAGGYILISALIVFNVEPDTFQTFFDAIYWATVSLTTVGYGDIFAVSTAGKIITMISSVFGIAIVALPAGIITAGYMEEINKNKESVKK
ncbi:MAG: ion transporter [Floccifex sp.]